MKEWILEHKDGLIRYGLLFIAFFIGLMLPSPFFRNEIEKQVIVEKKQEDHVDTTNMMIDGGLYSGSITMDTHKRDGYGRLIIQMNTGEETIYEGNWTDDKLTYGTRTTNSSVYTGHFDNELNNDGFGIINYSEAYIKGKSSQGYQDSEIIVTYIGNWCKNFKQGLGRVIKKDGSMEFGMYSEGTLQKPSGANYRIGGNIYGIDVSHWQTDIEWDNLALYCDENGNVLNTPSQHLQPIFFAYMKATEGATVKDEMFNCRMIEAERHGILKGAYHFLHVGSPVDEQLKNFFETVTWTPGDLPPALDVELESEIIELGVPLSQSIILEWLEKVEERIGVRPIIYTRESIRENYLNDPKFEKYKFWIARYERRPDNFDWQIWQTTERGQIRGCKDCVDIDIFHGDYDSFQRYLKSVGGKQD